MGSIFTNSVHVYCLLIMHLGIEIWGDYKWHGGECKLLGEVLLLFISSSSTSKTLYGHPTAVAIIAKHTFDFYAISLKLRASHSQQISCLGNKQVLLAEQEQ